MWLIKGNRSMRESSPISTEERAQSTRQGMFRLLLITKGERLISR